MSEGGRNNGQASDPLKAVHAKSTFIFATGIECSYPIINGPNGQPHRVDQMEKTFHYKHWKEDFSLVRQLGLKHLRYGPPYYRTHAGPEQYDWEWTDEVFAEIHRLGIVPIADLCDFGLADWAGDFQNPEWPELFAKFARAFAERLPWVQFYTPVNEIFVCAKLSTLTGAWNERRTDDERAFVTAVKHMCRANLLAIKEILEVRPDAIFIQSESAEYTHAGASDPGCVERANFENQRRFIPFDLLYCYHPNTDVGIYLFDNGITREEYKWFMGHSLGDHIVMGNDFYERN
ncbi:MAG TPA: family 1 glycosylhydrolase, partial [Chloroflexota bacterium]|nr:family 1 glycosylhydrolase [Chloroflexota bacterium]